MKNLEITTNSYGEKTFILNFNGMKFKGQDSICGRFFLKRIDWDLDKSDSNKVVESAIVVYHMGWKKFVNPLTNELFRVSDSDLEELKSITKEMILCL